MKKIYHFSLFISFLLSHANLNAQDNNIRLGVGAGQSIQNLGAANVMIGNYAGSATAYGQVNVMIGNGAGSYNSGGNYNTYIGNAAGANNPDGSFNTCIGDGAGYQLTSSVNMMLGVHAGFNTTSGASNVMIGGEAGNANTTGSSNTLIGTSTNVSSGNLINATAIGANAIVSASNTVVLGNNANVGIGTSNPGTFRLAVEGLIGAREIQVRVGSWSDFVFQKDYRLPKLSTVESYIQLHKHLPGIPAEIAVKTDGVALGEMSAKLLQKVEELTLYVIALEKRSQVQARRINALQRQINHH